MFENVFVESFSELEDPRVDKTKKHLLLDIVALSLMAIMSGAQCYTEIELFGEIHYGWLKQYLLLANGIPSHDTISRVMGALNPEKFNQCFLSWINKVKQLFPEDVVAIDGKSLCGSHNRSKAIKALHIVNAYSCANGLTLGQIKVEDKANEITAIPELLELLVLKGSIVTIDAMGCQKDIALAIVEQDADYVLAVKGNHRELYESIIDVFNLSRNEKFNRNLVPHMYRHEVTGEHGRIEERIVRSLPVKVIATQLELQQWGGIKSIVQVEHINHSNNSLEYRYYISSISAIEIEKLAKSIRCHWQVENNLHWVLDVVFKEDNSRVRDEVAAQNLSWIRKMAMFLLKQDVSKMSMRRKMLKYWANPQTLIKLMTTD
ncbi:MAG: ISAs1 family transposase [Burkholderiales bacterium]